MDQALGAPAALADRARALGRRALPYVPALAVSAVLAIFVTREITEQAGHAAVPLDDAFIHFQYAKRLAEGHLFSYVPGEGYTTGATSLVWPALLAPFFWLGFRGLAIIYVAWLFGTLAHAAVAVETARVADRLAGRAAAVGAGALCLVFGAFAWFAWSGMETVLLAWALMRSVRIASQWCERPHGDRSATLGRAAELAAFGIVTPLIRPEGAVASVIVAAALAIRSALPASRGGRALALAPLAGPLVTPAMHLAFAGHAMSATAMVKWMVGNPYHPDLGSLLSGVRNNAALLIGDVLDGGEWGSVFLPERMVYALGLGVIALAVAARRRSAGLRATFVLAVALATLIPCSYTVFLWNRLRYVWPFAGAWFVLLACLAREAGDLVCLLLPSAGYTTPLVSGVFVGVLGSHLPWAVRDLAESATAIDRQQVTLARWAADNLPANARIGVNDTGAIAYLGGRATFDVVGLTTEGEARYWVAGAGSRFEHYERLPRERLPTHFIVYPHWFACPPLLGAALNQATVVNQSILGGTTMIAYEARYTALGSGELPEAPPPGTLADALDVADLESEAAHEYVLDVTSDRDNQVAEVGDVADGGRLERRSDRFVLRLAAGREARLVARLGAEGPTEIAIRSGEHPLATVKVPATTWTEVSVSLPSEIARAATPLEVRTLGGRFGSFHYWAYQ